MTEAKSIFRRLREIDAVPTAHCSGLKKVLLSAAETRSAVTQIAVTEFRSGEKVEAHIHPTMDEHYIFLEGEAELRLDGQAYRCCPDDYLLVAAGVSHDLRALTDIKFVTIGVAYDK